MDDFKNKLYRFMYGRYGFDRLGAFLFAAGLVAGIISILFRIIPIKAPYCIFSALNHIFYIYAIFRIFSRNTYKRGLENAKYLHIRNKIIPFLDKKTRDIRDRNYIYKKCPKCGTKLRLKRIKGKHITKCPRCGAKFNVRVFIEYKNPYDGFNVL